MSQSSTQPTLPSNLDPNITEHFIHFYNLAYTNVRQSILSLWELFLNTKFDGINEAEIKEALEGKSGDLKRTFDYLVGKLVRCAEEGEIIQLDKNDLEDRGLMTAGHILFKDM